MLCGGKAASDKGYFIQPTVFGDVHDQMTIAREEVGYWLLVTYYVPFKGYLGKPPWKI